MIFLFFFSQVKSVQSSSSSGGGGLFETLENWIFFFLDNILCEPTTTSKKIYTRHACMPGWLQIIHNGKERQSVIQLNCWPCCLGIREKR